MSLACKVAMSGLVRSRAATCLSSPPSTRQARTSRFLFKGNRAMHAEVGSFPGTAHRY